MDFLKQKLLEFVLKHNPAKFCFILYDLLKTPEKCQIVGKINNQTSIIFKFLNHYVFYGIKCFNYFNEIPHEKGVINIAFDEENLSNIQKHFQGFTCSDKSGEGPYNYFLNMCCDNFQFKRELQTSSMDTHLITTDDWTDNVPLAIKNLLKQSNICYGFVHGGKLVSCAPAPNLYLGKDASKFAIIRGVWTDPSFRRKGLATSSMKKLCIKLFDEFSIENIYLWVEERNPTAIGIYKKLGFQIKGKWWGSQCFFS